MFLDGGSPLITRWSHLYPFENGDRGDANSAQTAPVWSRIGQRACDLRNRLRINILPHLVPLRRRSDFSPSLRRPMVGGGLFRIVQHDERYIGRMLMYPMSIEPPQVFRDTHLKSPLIAPEHNQPTKHNGTYRNQRLVHKRQFRPIYFPSRLRRAS